MILSIGIKYRLQSQSLLQKKHTNRILRGFRSFTRSQKQITQTVIYSLSRFARSRKQITQTIFRHSTIRFPHRNLPLKPLFVLIRAIFCACEYLTAQASASQFPAFKGACHGNRFRHICHIARSQKRTLLTVLLSGQQFHSLTNTTPAVCLHLRLRHFLLLIYNRIHASGVFYCHEKEPGP